MEVAELTGKTNSAYRGRQLDTDGRQIRSPLLTANNDMTRPRVAALLTVTPRTVAFHKYRLMEQLNIRSTAELIQFAIVNHIV